MPKTHFSRNGYVACGRTSKRTTGVTSQVTCGHCVQSERFVQADARQRLAAKAAFDAQEPRTVPEPWVSGAFIICTCGGTLFRDSGRTCYGHYDNWVCAACGKTASRLTETGMSF